MQTTDRQRLERCAGRLLGKLRRTARRWAVLPEGCGLAVAVSGGSDSLAMAYLLTEHNRRIKDPLKLTAIHVCLDASGATSGLSRDIKAWLEDRGLPLVEVAPRLDGSEELPLDCFACGRARRRTLLEGAEAHGSSHVALGHHADDVVETWLMSLFYTGSPEAMPPLRSYFAGAVTVTRPLYELQKGELNRLARLAEIPQPAAACVREDASKRQKIREVLTSLGKDQKLVKRQLFWAATRQLETTPVQPQPPIPETKN